MIAPLSSLPQQNCQAEGFLRCEWDLITHLLAVPLASPGKVLEGHE